MKNMLAGLRALHSDRKVAGPDANQSYTFGFEGMTEEESAPLLHFLLEHGNRPEFTCRFRWKRGSIAFWDNRSCKHLAVHDADRFRRLMRRTQIKGGPLR